ncbi:hypothetical protein [Pseudomonas syringae]|nr:hypothetical protein [Pseudomonas syringae]
MKSTMPTKAPQVPLAERVLDAETRETNGLPMATKPLRLAE